MASSKGIGIGGGAGGPKTTAPVTTELDKLSVEQLRAVKEQADLEVNLLQDSLNNIRTATARLDIASNALNDLSLRPQGKKMLVPLTASLYVPGTLDDADKVLVDVGTGYFIEKTMVEGKDYCERKINLLKSNYDQLLETFYSWLLLQQNSLRILILLRLGEKECPQAKAFLCAPSHAFEAFVLYSSHCHSRNHF
ncbi:unnamed protein product [Coffea canephora]|uniref:DH200=94 genomic scaffold, scaffold_322 n=1 Tax=Coffea canephora TaxID=49390 RepID=A0A068VEE6_COFCA|nr:unnamed protein product [Coffea canephora]